MYYYLYDNSLSEKKYRATLARIESRLTDLGINGKINRLSFLKNINQIIKEEIRQGVNTIVIVGNDKTISQMINLLADFNVTIGIIPLGQTRQIADILGIPDGEAACNILSSRITEKIDLGLINGHYYFFTSLQFGGKNITLSCDDSYFINLENKNSIIEIHNLAAQRPYFSLVNGGRLNLIIKTVTRKLSFKNRMDLSNFSSKKIIISSVPSLPILLTDEKRIIKTPAEVKIIPKKIRLIVGKKRQF